ncbi:MAG TPA: FCD domain-containing protein [Pseudonocardia sp.]
MTAHYDARRTAVPDARQTTHSGGGPPGADHPGGANKLAARVARDIENDIRALNWPIGEVLGSESELRTRYKVSRAVLREAIRLVEHHQVAAMRRGPAGGLVVREPDAGPATNAMIVYLEFVGTTVEHVLAARMLIEPLAAAMAAEHINEAGIARLRREVGRQDPPVTGAVLLNARNELHLVLAELSGNPALRLFVDVLLRLTARYWHEGLDRRMEDGHPVVGEGHSAHEVIVSAVVAGEASRAEFRACQHLEAVSEFILSAGPDPVPRPPSSIWGGTAPGHTQDQKLAEVVARRIITEISEGGWTVGSVIGSETALLERFEVSRAVLREAVRLLEYHSVARMRRGPGGGLVVAKPDPSASIEAMALYLDYQQTEVAHLRALRERVEIGCVDYVAAKAGDPEVAHRLRLAGKDDGTGPGRDDELPHRLHTEIAELSGNPVLSLFLRVLTTLWARQHAATMLELDHPLDAELRATDRESVDLVHRSLVEALIAGDVSLARHRMRRHLETLTAWWN